MNQRRDLAKNLLLKLRSCSFVKSDETLVNRGFFKYPFKSCIMVLSFIASTQTRPNQIHLNLLVLALYYDFIILTV